MHGTRLDDGVLADDPFQPGTYGRVKARAGSDELVWHAVTPDGMAANLAAHDVIEHQDGTITVSPSILVDNGQRSWHGYLEHGVWRSV